MITFDQVLPALLRICHGRAPLSAGVTRICVVRDVRGRVRLVLEAKEAKLDFAPLEAELLTTLGAYFVAPIMTSASVEMKRLSTKILELSSQKWPAGWPRTITNLLGGAEVELDVGGRWTGVDRTIGKEAWLSTSTPGPPWPLLAGKTPPIATFHSFKGGVGRTTLVGAYAIHLARLGRRVAVVDLDLEAPGVGALLGVATERGVLDVLVDHIATETIDLADASARAQIDGSVDGKITVFPAGRVTQGYVQKLARLDFSSTEPGANNPVGVAITAMLKQMKADYDVVLLDSRAGLHDLAGMSLHGLAHIDVLVFRGTTQNLAGLEQTLRTLGARDGEPEIILVETLLPSDEKLFAARRERTLDAVYAQMIEHVYGEDGDDPPQRDDRGGAHDVVPVRRREWLDGLDSLAGRVEEVLSDPGLREVAKRLDLVCGFIEDVSAADVGVL